MTVYLIAPVAESILSKLSPESERDKSRPTSGRICTCCSRGTRAPVAVVDVSHVAAPHSDSDLRNRSDACGRDQQKDVVGHQCVGVERAVLGRQRLADPLQVGMVVLFVENARLTIVTPLHSLQWDCIEMDGAAAGHAKNISEIEPRHFLLTGP